MRGLIRWRGVRARGRVRGGEEPLVRGGPAMSAPPRVELEPVVNRPLIALAVGLPLLAGLGLAFIVRKRVVPAIPEAPLAPSDEPPAPAPVAVRLVTRAPAVRPAPPGRRRGPSKFAAPCHPRGPASAARRSRTPCWATLRRWIWEP